MNRCPNEIGTYKGCIYLEFPKHMLKEYDGFYETVFGCDVDYCIAGEIQDLWDQGVTTYGSCCGHGINEGMINVDEKDVSKMYKLGYKLFPSQKGMYPYTFIPKSRHK
ncbi:hypothetical protein CIL05_07425 [Virgibacillus profundi]|uniref:Uncharacterized protein n=1 Tax=Virgibacillus profundi TaxID=2024555 RepID=A0A2A2IE56_9BACI|nr:hypothetical protein [Virgibacillus profundi]PAV30291.1 hypothetical protein CIL05_07425 [Virgibacillus profundi]PXY54463.1 hypothetical protein CIT14_07510 [Virgibacillus profundi]